MSDLALRQTARLQWLGGPAFAYFVGGLLATIGAAWAIGRIVDRFYPKPDRPPFPGSVYRLDDKPPKWRATLFGVIERGVYFVAFATGREVLAVAWLAAKTLDAWHPSDNAKRHYLMGSGLSILYAFAGLGVTESLLARRPGLAGAIVLLGLFVSMATTTYIDDMNGKADRRSGH